MNFYRKYIFFVVLNIFCILSFDVLASNATSKMTEALKQRSKGNVNSAIKLLNEAIKNSDDVKQKNMAKFMLGDCLIENEKYSDAIEIYEKLLKSSLSSDEKSEALFNLMKAYSSTGDDNKVSQLYKRLVSEAPYASFSEVAKAFYSSLYGNNATDSISSTAKKNSNKQNKQNKEKDKNDDDKKIAKTQNKKTDIKTDNKTKVKPEKKQENIDKKQANNKTSIAKSSNVKSSKKLSKKTTDLLVEILTPKSVSEGKKEELASSILLLQEKLMNNEKSNGADSLLLELANNTADFGEYVEACKTYDKLLNYHPSSPYVEKAYYEAIRLRAILGVHEAVVSWGNAFLKSFPSSAMANKVKALIEYSKLGGNVELEKGTNSVDGNKSIVSKDINSLLKDNRYKKATQDVKDGKYEEAIEIFDNLGKEYGNVSQLWWETALVNVQMEDFKSAAKSINKMLELEPNNEDANSLAGYIHYRLENYEEAANAYENVGEADGHGVNFFDAKSASKKMRNTVKNN